MNMARENMLSQQIRTWDVLDDAVLAAIAKTPRAEFVPTAWQEFAYADLYIPLGHNQVMMTPKEEGRLLQALQVKPTDRILEVGTGSGFLTALLARLGHFVYSVDIFEDFIHTAKITLKDYANISLAVADAAQNKIGDDTYDVIVITAANEILPSIFKTQLAENGRLFAVLGHAPAMQAILIEQQAKDTWSETSLFELVVPNMIHGPTVGNFRF